MSTSQPTLTSHIKEHIQQAPGRFLSYLTLASLVLAGVLSANFTLPFRWDYLLAYTTIDKFSFTNPIDPMTGTPGPHPYLSPYVWLLSHLQPQLALTIAAAINIIAIFTLLWLTASLFPNYNTPIIAALLFLVGWGTTSFIWSSSTTLTSLLEGAGLPSAVGIWMFLLILFLLTQPFFWTTKKTQYLKYFITALLVAALLFIHPFTAFAALILYLTTTIIYRTYLPSLIALTATAALTYLFDTYLWTPSDLTDLTKSDLEFSLIHKPLALDYLLEGKYLFVLACLIPATIATIKYKNLPIVQTTALTTALYILVYAYAIITEQYQYARTMPFAAMLIFLLAASWFVSGFKIYTTTIIAVGSVIYLIASAGYVPAWFINDKTLASLNIPTRGTRFDNLQNYVAGKTCLVNAPPPAAREVIYYGGFTPNFSWPNPWTVNNQTIAAQNYLTGTLSLPEALRQTNTSCVVDTTPFRFGYASYEISKNPPLYIHFPIPPNP